MNNELVNRETLGQVGGPLAFSIILGVLYISVNSYFGGLYRPINLLNYCNINVV
jgi:hypothetical protein